MPPTCSNCPSAAGEDSVTLTIKVWSDACRTYPLWAVQKAADWWSRGVRDDHDLGHFLSDVKLATGNQVLECQKLLKLAFNQ